MRLQILRRPCFRPVAKRSPFRRVCRPLVEMLECRVVPSLIDYSMGFANHSGLTANGAAMFTGSVAQLSDGNVNEAGSFFTNSKFDITQFTTTFTLSQTLGPVSHVTADGLTFTIQNDPRGPAALGTTDGGLGYEGIANSIAIKFDLFDNAGEGSNSTGIFTNGRAPTVRQSGLDPQFPDTSISLDGSGINLHSQDPLLVTLTYDGSTLSESVHDNVTGATFTHSYSLSISALIGTHTAYLGFTGATSELAAVQDIHTWIGDFGPPSPPTLTSLSTTTAQEGSAGLTLTLNGSDFLANSTAQWNGTNLPTTFVSPSQLLAVVPPSLLGEEGTASVAVFNPGAGGGITSAPLTFTITDAPLTGSAVAFSPTPGTPFTGVVATFTDANSGAPVSDFTATITWGDGNISAGTITALGGGNFSVSGTNTYLQGGTFVLNVAIADDGGAAATVINTVSVGTADLPLTATGVNLTATEGAAFSGVVATFTDADPTATPASYSLVTVTWGDGQQSAGTVVVNPNGGFEVLGSHTYPEEGSYTLQVFILDAGGASATANSTAQVADAPLTAMGVTINPSPGTPFTGVVATFTDANSKPDISDFTATILWGNGNTSTGTITENANGSFSVTGTNTYETAATFSITVVINDRGGSTATAMSTARVGTVGIADQPLTATGLDIAASVSVAQDFTVAEFTDPDPNAQTGTYAVAINWGDGTALDPGRVTQPGGKGTPFFVDYTHTYAQAGSFTVHVQIFDEAGAYAQTFSTATVTSGAAPRSSRGGKALPPVLAGQADAFLNPAPALTTNGSQQGPEQPFQKQALAPGGNAESAVLLAQRAFSMPSQRPGPIEDTYWALLYLRSGDHVSAANDLSAYELALALEGNSVQALH